MSNTTRLLRKGDVVSVPGTIKYDVYPHDPYIHIKVEFEYGPGETILIQKENTHHITVIAPHFEVGERVVTSSGEVGFIRGIHGHYAWIECEVGRDPRPFTITLPELTPAPLGDVLAAA